MTAAEIVLRVVVAVLPRRRRDWGTAMHAELATLDKASTRWSFVFGCVLATASQFSLRAAGGILASAAAFGGVLVLTAHTGYPPLRWALVAYVALFVAIVWSGRLPSLAPAGRHARRVRVAYLVVLGLFATGVVTGLSTGGDPADRAISGVPILAAVSTCYLVAVLIATAHHDGADATVLGGAAVGVIAGVLWAATVLVFPPVPAKPTTTFLLMSVAGIVATAVALRRPDGPASPVAPGLLAAATCALVVVCAVRGIGSLAPLRFIPLLPAGGGPPTQAARITQSRTELGDPYVPVLMIGALSALMFIGVMRKGRRSHAARPVPLSEITDL